MNVIICFSRLILTKIGKDFILIKRKKYGKHFRENVSNDFLVRVLCHKKQLGPTQIMVEIIFEGVIFR